jgi:hypothetical protein
MYIGSRRKLGGIPKSQRAAYGETIQAKKDSEDRNKNPQVCTSTTTATATQNKLLSEDQINAMIDAELKKDAMGFDDSKSFKFEVSKYQRIELYPKLTKIDEQYVFGKGRRKSDGTLDKGPNGELYHADTGEVLMNKFTDDKGNKRPLRPSKRYIYYGSHFGNKEEQEKPLRFVASKESAETIQKSIRQTHIFDIGKENENKFSIWPYYGEDEEELAEREDYEQN